MLPTRLTSGILIAYIAPGVAARKIASRTMPNNNPKETAQRGRWYMDYAPGEKHAGIGVISIVSSNTGRTNGLLLSFGELGRV